MLQAYSNYIVDKCYAASADLLSSPGRACSNASCLPSSSKELSFVVKRVLVAALVGHRVPFENMNDGLMAPGILLLARTAAHEIRRSGSSDPCAATCGTQDRVGKQLGQELCSTSVG